MESNARLQLESVEAGLRFGVETGRFTWALDSGPEATAPSPIHAVLASVGGCTAMDVISILRKKRQQVTGYEVQLNGVRADEHPKVFTMIEVVHRFTGRGLSPAAIEEAIQLSETKYCSVHAMLHASVKLTSRYEIVEAGAGIAGP